MEGNQINTTSLFDEASSCVTVAEKRDKVKYCSTPTSNENDGNDPNSQFSVQHQRAKFGPPREWTVIGIDLKWEPKAAQYSVGSRSTSTGQTTPGQRHPDTDCSWPPTVNTHTRYHRIHSKFTVSLLHVFMIAAFVVSPTLPLLSFRVLKNRMKQDKVSRWCLKS